MKSVIKLCVSFGRQSILVHADLRILGDVGTLKKLPPLSMKMDGKE